MQKAEGVALGLKCFSIRNAEGYVFVYPAVWTSNIDSWHHRIVQYRTKCIIKSTVNADTQL
jgi:hypothetical protein